MRKVYTSYIEACLTALEKSYELGEEHVVVSTPEEVKEATESSEHRIYTKNELHLQEKSFYKIAGHRHSSSSDGWSRSVYGSQDEHSNPCPIMFKCELPYRRVYRRFG